MIQLLHQCQQPTDFSFGKTGAGEPVQIVAGQIGNQVTLILAIGHDARHQQLQVFRIHWIGAIGDNSACGLACSAKDS